MYSFSRMSTGRFNIYRSFVKQGDTHKKCFAAGVTPQNQATVNVYVSGQFQFVCGSFSQVMDAGSCNLDLATPEFEEGVVCVETVLSPTANRYCVSSIDNLPFNRFKLHLEQEADHRFLADSLVFVLKGSADLCGVIVNAGGFALLGAGSIVTGPVDMLVVS